MEYAVYAMLKATKEFAKVDPNDESDELLSDIRNSSDDWADEENWTKSRVLPSGNFLSEEDAKDYAAMLWSWDDDLESKFIPGTAEIRQEET